jgi:DNA modification methylase
MTALKKDTNLTVTEKSIKSYTNVRSFIFACTNATQDECFSRLLFGCSKVYGAAAMKVKSGDFLFLWNLDTDLLYGVFRAASDSQRNIEKEAWGGSYPYQVRATPLIQVVALKETKKLLKKLEISNSSLVSCRKTIVLLDLYRQSDKPMDSWVEHLCTVKPEEMVVTGEMKSWQILAEIKKQESDETEEEIPQMQSTTFWDFPKQSYGVSKKGDNKYAGVTPAELIWNLIWRYTEPGDIVLDPMCGSGTTLDVCKEEGRRAICYDIAPPANRPDLIKNDARHIPLPDNHVDLIFVDSPYGDNIRYNEEVGCIGNISSENKEFYDELEKVIKECHRTLKPGKVIGWLIGDQWVKKKFTPVSFLLYSRLLDYFETVDIICVARRNQSSNTGVWTNRALRHNFYLRGFKYLFIMRKLQGEQVPGQERKINWKYPLRRKDKENKSP